MKEQTGNEDQRFVDREDHDAARKWFQKTARAHDKRWTEEDCRENLRKLREQVDLAVDTKLEANERRRD